MSVLACVNGHGEPGICVCGLRQGGCRNCPGACNAPSDRTSVLAVLVIVGIWAWLVRRAFTRRVVSGTAHVLSLKKSAGYREPRRCRIELEVNIPGREPYVKLQEQKLGPTEQDAAQPGRTLQVWVDPKRKRYIYID